MENASKALIIAGAILLSILIIALGMYIFHSSTGAVEDMKTQLSAQEIQNFNDMWLSYEGLQSGAKVRSMISKMTSNTITNKEVEEKLIDLYYEEKQDGAEIGGNGKLVIASVGNENINLFNNARAAIDLKHTYRVTVVLSKKSAIATAIMVTYNPEYNVETNPEYEKFKNR